MSEPRFIQTDGFLGEIAYSISGPPELVKAVTNFIRSLTRMHGGLPKYTQEYKQTNKQSKIDNSII